MIIKLQRDSVCMSDDIDAPHNLELELENNNTIADLIDKTVELNYLPNTNAIWILSDVSNNNELAAFYNTKKCFYKDKNLLVSKLNAMNLKFIQYEKRKTYISEEEAEYAESSEYKFLCVKGLLLSILFLTVIIFLFFSCFANAIYPLIK